MGGRDDCDQGGLRCQEGSWNEVVSAGYHLQIKSLRRGREDRELYTTAKERAVISMTVCFLGTSSL